MFNQVLTGVQNQSDGVVVTARGGKQGEQMTSEMHGPGYEQTYRGNVFSVETQGTGITTTAALATTWTGLAVGNPAGSGVNLSLLSFTCAQFAVGAAATIGIMGGLGSIAASLTPQSRVIGGGQVSKMTASAGATISTPLLITTIGQVGSLATTGYGLTPGLVLPRGQPLIVPPGSFIATYTSIVTTSALQFGFLWEEVLL